MILSQVSGLKTLVSSAGIEPASPPSEGDILSIELRGRKYLGDIYAVLLSQR